MLIIILLIILVPSIDIALQNDGSVMYKLPLMQNVIDI